MKRTIKVLIGLFGFTVVVIAAGVIALFVYINAVGKAGIERGATYALGVPTRLDNIDIRFISGSVELNGLNIANPSGFETSHFMDLGRGFVNVSFSSLRGDKVTLPELTLSKLDVNLERQNGKSNYDAIFEGLKKFESDTPPPAEQSEGKKFVVKKIVVDNVTVNAAVALAIGEPMRVPIKIERIELSDVGSDSGGVVLSKLSGIIVAAVLEAIVKEAGSVLPAAIREGLGTQLAQIGKLTETTTKIIGEVTVEIDGQVKKLNTIGHKMLNDVTKGGQDVTESFKKSSEELKAGADGIGKNVGTGISSIGKNVEKGLGGLFGKKKNE